MLYRNVDIAGILLQSYCGSNVAQWFRLHGSHGYKYLDKISFRNVHQKSIKI